MAKNTAGVSLICTPSFRAPFTLAELQAELLADTIPVQSIVPRAVQDLSASSADPQQFEFLVTVGASDEDRVRSICESKACRIQTIVDVDQSDADDVAWFPRSLADLDENCKNIFTYGVELDSDHPGFLDVEYRERRSKIAMKSAEYRMGTPITAIAYTANELRTWNTCLTHLLQLYPTHACAKYNEIRLDMFEQCGYQLDHIPQLDVVSNYVHERSGFRIRPVGGLLSPRAFLAGLGFRVYHATQYVRHGSRPFYTPEPDVCHELLGHLPMFADPEFADFVNQIGLASLGAPDEDIERLSTCMWYTVEFGLCHESNGLRAYGGGLLSSVDELQHALSGKPEVRDFDPISTVEQTYAITEFQPVYYAAASIQRARDQMTEYAETIPRPFTVRYDRDAETVVFTSKNQH